MNRTITVIYLCVHIFVLGSCLTSCSVSDKKGEPLKSSWSWSIDTNNPVLTGENTNITNIADPAVIHDGFRFQLWAGCVESDLSYASICYSESMDGTVWSNPVIVFSPSSSGWDNQMVEIPTVLYDAKEMDSSKRYKMWYGGSSSANPGLTKIGYATSQDGINWTRLDAGSSVDNKPGLVIDPGDMNVASDPQVIQVNGTFHIFYNIWGANDRLFINHGISSDGIIWVEDLNNPVLEADQDWEDGAYWAIQADDVVHPTAVYTGENSQFHMWYGSFDTTGNETYSGIGYAYSADGSNWIKEINNPVFTPDHSRPGEEIGLSTGPAVLLLNGFWHLFYTGVDASASRMICHAEILR